MSYHEINNELNNDEYDSFYSYDDDDDSVVYEAEQRGNTRYNIILCELYNEGLHGETNDIELKSSYLVYCRFKKLDMEYIEDYMEDFNAHYLYLINKNDASVVNHSVFRNYKNIILKQPYIRPEIAECVYLENEDCVAILKTHWLRLIQRTWKNIMNQRKCVIQKRTSLNSLHHREITGRWPSDCQIYPELKGMISGLSCCKS